MLTVEPALCSGCRRCEVNCAFFHSGRIGRSGARIKVVKFEASGIDYPVVCQQCRERYCLRCPEKAIRIGPLGQVIVSRTVCTLCGSCEARCPIGALEIADGIPYVCDLCGGAPRCIEQCNLGAVRYAPDVRDAVSLGEFKRDSRGLTPEEKRVRFARARTRALRHQWSRERSA